MKRELPPAHATRLINNGPCVLVTCAEAARANVFTVSWSMPVSIVPPYVAISCVKSNLSHGMIDRAGEYVINVPEENLLEAVMGCGKRSGRDTDKFAAFGLTAVPGRTVRAPSIAECAGYIECRVIDRPVYGDFSLFVAEVTAAYAEDTKFASGRWIPDRARLLHHIGDEYFTLPGDLRKSSWPPPEGSSATKP